MIDNVRIQNFKSIRDLTFDTRRVNVFIGEPNTGKSNILEALGMFAFGHVRDIRQLVRFKRMSDIFYDNQIQDSIKVQADGDCLTYKFGKNVSVLNYTFSTDPKDYFFGIKNSGVTVDQPYDYELPSGYESWKTYFKTYEESKELYFKPYRFQNVKKFVAKNGFFLYPPHGENLYDVIHFNPSVREIIAEILKSKGYKLNLDVERKEINMLKEFKDVVYTYPYTSLSDTLQRLMFYIAALESNKKSALLFEEPESNIFPFYNKYLAELIAQTESENQFFIATHNPYFLGSLIFKTPIRELAVYITYMDNYETKLRLLSNDEIEELASMDTGMFFNLDLFLPQA